MRKTFRALNEAENTLLTQLVKKGRLQGRDLRNKKKFQIYYETQAGGFTTCLLLLPSGALWVGASRCSFKDQFRPITGALVALRRAALHHRVVSLPKDVDESAPLVVSSADKANETLGAEGRSARSRKAAETRRARVERMIQSTRGAIGALAGEGEVGRTQAIAAQVAGHLDSILTDGPKFL